MLNELSNDPIQRAIARLEKQHEEDKQVYVVLSIIITFSCCIYLLRACSKGCAREAEAGV